MTTTTCKTSYFGQHIPKCFFHEDLLTCILCFLGWYAVKAKQDLLPSNVSEGVHRLFNWRNAQPWVTPLLSITQLNNESVSQWAHGPHVMSPTRHRTYGALWAATNKNGNSHAPDDLFFAIERYGTGLGLVVALPFLGSKNGAGHFWPGKNGAGH